MKELAGLTRQLVPGQTVPEALWNDLVSLILTYSRASAAIGRSDYLQRRRAHAAGGRRFRPALAKLDVAQVLESLSWAVHAPGEAGEPPSPEALQKRVEGSVVRLVRQTDRETIIDATDADPIGARWARVPEGPKTCAFCALLCTRGAVYYDDTAKFQAHDHCDCTAVPVFEGQDYRPPAHVTEWEKLYAKATRFTSGKESIKAFRLAYEAA